MRATSLLCAAFLLALPVYLAAGEHLDAEGFPLPAEALARVGSARFRHGSYLEQLAYSPDGKVLASAGHKQLRLWDASTGKLLHAIPFSTNPDIIKVGFTADGRCVVANTGATCQWFDVVTGKETQTCTVPMHRTNRMPTLAPHGEAVVVIEGGPDSNLVVRDLPSGKERFRQAAGESATWSWYPTFTADGKTLAADLNRGDGKHAIRFFRVSDGKLLGEFDPQDSYNDLALSPDGTRLAGRKFPKALGVWKVPSGELVFKTEVAATATVTAAFTPDSKGVVVGTQNLDALLLDAATGKELRRFRTYPSSVALAGTPDGKTLAIGTTSGAITQWDLATGKLLPAATYPVAGFGQFTFDRDSKLLWTIPGPVAALEWRSGREVRRLANPPGGGTAYPTLSFDRSRAAGVINDQQLSVWDTATGKVLREIPAKNGPWTARAFSADARTLYVGEWQAPVRAWDVATGRELPAFDTVNRVTHALAVSPDGRWLAAADHPQAAGVPSPDVTVWELPKGREAFRLKPPADDARVWSLAFSADNQFLAAAGGSKNVGTRVDSCGFVTTWDLRTGKPRFARTGLPGWGMTIAVSSDGHSLATGTGEHMVYLWETATGQERHRFTGHTSSISRVAFSPDGKLLASASADAPLYVWDLSGNFDKPPETTAFTPEEEERLWKTLGGADAAAAFQAMRQLLARPGPATALLAKRLPPAVRIDAKAIEQQIRALDADDFATRKRAAEELKKADEQAEPLLRQALKNNPSPEARRQIEEMLEGLENVTPEQVRQIRAVEVLERLGTDEARKLLAKLAGGAKDALLTREAKAALERLTRP